MDWLLACFLLKSKNGLEMWDQLAFSSKTRRKDREREKKEKRKKKRERERDYLFTEMSSRFGVSTNSRDNKNKFTPAALAASTVF